MGADGIATGNLKSQINVKRHMPLRPTQQQAAVALHGSKGIGNLGAVINDSVGADVLHGDYLLFFMVLLYHVLRYMSILFCVKFMFIRLYVYSNLHSVYKEGRLRALAPQVVIIPIAENVHREARIVEPRGELFRGFVEKVVSVIDHGPRDENHFLQHCYVLLDLMSYYTMLGMVLSRGLYVKFLYIRLYG